MNARNVLGIIATILAVLLCWTSYKSCGLSKSIDEVKAQNVSLNEKVGDLEQLKSDLQTQVDSLESAYNTLSEENATLATTVEEEKAKSRRRYSTIKKLKTSHEAALSAATSENASLRAQISALLAAKSQLESNINDLQTENQSLRDKLGMVEENLTKAKSANDELDQLNKAMQSEIANLTLANFKATAFQVEVEKKWGSKLTAKGRKAKRIKASFDLTNVPEKYQGVRPIYLTITDANASPIYLENPIKATVSVNGQDSQILAAEQKEINIKENQRISFNHQLGKKLKKGFYRVVVYTDIGVLGASTIKLR